MQGAEIRNLLTGQVTRPTQTTGTWRTRQAAPSADDVRGALVMAPSEQIKSASTPQYLTPEQIAAALQVHPATVYRWAASDASMPATRMGKTIRFRADLLDRWLAARTQRSRRQQIDHQSVESTETGTSSAA